MVINSHGNVGINDTSPSYRLSVGGSFRVHGNVATFGSDGLLHINSRSTYHGSETVALQTVIDNRALTDANPGTYGGEDRNVLALQPDGGRVGLGTISPAYKLDVSGNCRFTGEIYTSSSFYSDGNRSVIRGGSPTLYFRDTNEMSAMLHNNSNLLYVLRGGTDSESWSAVNGVWPWYWNLSNNDSTCGGSLYCYGNVTAYSDLRHKEDIVKLDNCLEKVEKLNGYTYTRKNDGKRYTGLIAQEVLEVLPEAVSTDEKGEYALAYGNMAGLLVEAMKEMKSKLDVALARIDTLEKKIRSLM
jgi:hypothetical protein